MGVYVEDAFCGWFENGCLHYCNLTAFLDILNSALHCVKCVNMDSSSVIPVFSICFSRLLFYYGDFNEYCVYVISCVFSLLAQLQEAQEKHDLLEKELAEEKQARSKLSVAPQVRSQPAHIELTGK